LKFPHIVLEVLETEEERSFGYLIGLFDLLDDAWGHYSFP